jgi:hypothetical protein
VATLVAVAVTVGVAVLVLVLEGTDDEVAVALAPEEGAGLGTCEALEDEGLEVDAQAVSNSTVTATSEMSLGMDFFTPPSMPSCGTAHPNHTPSIGYF